MVFLLCPGFSAWADSPDFIKGAAMVDAEQFLALVNQTPELVVVDSRMRIDRKNGYLEGSVNLPDVETNCHSLGEVISNFAIPVVFYCNGVKCGRSAKAVTKALECGYHKVYWFRGGFEEWRNKGYPFLTE